MLFVHTNEWTTILMLIKITFENRNMMTRRELLQTYSLVLHVALLDPLYVVTGGYGFLSKRTTLTFTYVQFKSLSQQICVFSKLQQEILA